VVSYIYSGGLAWWCNCRESDSRWNGRGFHYPAVSLSGNTSGQVVHTHVRANCPMKVEMWKK